MKDRRSRNRKRLAAESADVTGTDMRSKITQIFDIPQGAMAGVSQMELSGNREAVIDGCVGVLAYDEDVVRLALRGMVATFHGRGLQIKVLTHDSAIVAGYITNIEFSV